MGLQKSQTQLSNFTFTFPIWIPFISFSFVIGLPIQCWVEMVRVSILVLSARRLSAFCHNWLLFGWDMFPLYSLWWEFYGCWILSSAFPVPIEVFVWFLSFLFLMCYITLIDAYMSDYLCDLERLQLDHNMILFMCCWIQFANLVEGFCIYIHKDIDLYLSFLISSLSDFGIKVLVAS